MEIKKVNIMWFRRDLRLHDNHALFLAASCSVPVVGIFIFDPQILEPLENKSDARVSLIFDTLIKLQKEFNLQGKHFFLCHGNPQDIFKDLFVFFKCNHIRVENIYCNRDYEPQAIKRDQSIQLLCLNNQTGFISVKDHLIFEQNELLTGSKTPYLVFTPFKNSWNKLLSASCYQSFDSKKQLANSPALQIEKGNVPLESCIGSLKDFGFIYKNYSIPINNLQQEFFAKYSLYKDIPSVNATSRKSVDLRFGLISVREMVSLAKKFNSPSWLNEIIWRDYFFYLLAHFPHTAKHSFKAQFEHIQWNNSNSFFRAWCNGHTGFPLIDAGMRQLNETGFMPNRVRMLTASFLVKNLLIDWKKGEEYFAGKLLDFELSSNVGNWQWVAGTGCDAAPYFRVFNPWVQQKKFDPKDIYVKRWIPELGTSKYPKPIVDFNHSRMVALQRYKEAASIGHINRKDDFNK